MKLYNVLKIRFTLCLVLFASFAVSSPLLGQGYEIVAVARPGDPAPDGGVFFAAYSPSINDAGQVAFAARLWDIRMGLYLYDRGRLTTIARRGDPADRCEGTLALFGSPSLSDSGQIAFSGGLSRGAGIFFFDGSQIRAIVCSGEPAPGGGTLAGAFIPTMNNAAQVAFYALLEVPDDGVLFREGVFFFDGARIQRIAATGDPAPGGGTYVRVWPPSLNDQGQIVFSGTVSAPDRGGLFLFEKDIHQIVRNGDPAPGGGTFAGISTPSMNNAGQVVFGAELREPSGWGIFLFDQGEIRRIVPSRDPETGEEIRGPGEFSINDLGQVAFGASRARNDRIVFGLFLFDGESFTDIVLAGDPMPGGGTFWDFHSLSLNTSGQLAFTAGFPVPHNATGMFLASPPAGLEERTR